MIVRHALAPRGATRRALLAGLATSFATAFATASAPRAAQARENGPPDEDTAIAVSGRPLTAFHPLRRDEMRFGQLLYRGGLHLTSDAEGFGGFSGLHVSRDGQRLVAVSDRGAWFTARIERDGGRLSALTDARLAPILGASGRPLARGRSFDAESLSIADGVAYVGFERTHEIMRFDFGRRGVMARAASISVPRPLRKLPRNRSLEALAVAPASSPIAGAIVAISERSEEHDEPTIGAIIGGPSPGLITLRLKDGYEATDIAFLPGGDMLLLERWYRPLRGVGARIRRIAGAAIRPDAELDGPTIFEADLAQEIDNMEGLAVHQRGSATMLTLISDNNFSSMQRTLLLEFEMAG
jgi:hypothetical protein